MLKRRIESALKPLASKCLGMPWHRDSAMTILNADLSDLRAFDLKV
jgi:hypothetical protein